jgi:hypothetical protein
MEFDYSISLQGLCTAENQLNDAARKVSRPVYCSGTGASDLQVTDRLTLTGGLDIAGAMVEAQEAKIIYTANLKMIETQMELQDEALNLFG